VFMSAISAPLKFVVPVASAATDSGRNRCRLGSRTILRLRICGRLVAHERRGLPAMCCFSRCLHGAR